MSEVKRYNVFDVPTHAGHSLVERVEKDGKWVLFEDYAALHLQVQTLISANEDLRLEWTVLANERDDLRKRLYEQGLKLQAADALLREWRKERRHAGHVEGYLADSDTSFDDRCGLCKRTDEELEAANKREGSSAADFAISFMDRASRTAPVPQPLTSERKGE